MVGAFETRVIKRDGPLLSSEFLVIFSCSVQSDLKATYSGNLYQQGCDQLYYEEEGINKIQNDKW